MSKVKTLGAIKKFRKIFVRTVLALLLLFVVTILVFSLPAVQTRIARKVTNDLNKEFGTNINIDRVGLKWNGDVTLKGIYIEDYKKDTLVYIGTLNTSVLNVKKAIDGQLEFGDIDVETLTFNIKTYAGERDTNLDIFVEKLEKNDTIPSTEPSSFLLTSDNIEIENGIFRFIDLNDENPDILEFKQLHADVNDFKVQGPNVYANIDALSFVDKRNLVVDRLKTNFTYTLNQMRFDELSIKTKASLVQGNLVFDYDREDFKEFMDKVKVTAKFNESNVSFDEVNLFYNEFGSFKKATFSTSLSGVLNDFKTKNFRLSSGTTRIDGDIHFKNILTSKRPFYLEGDFKRISSNYYQLKGLLPNILGSTLPTTFEKLGQFNINGHSIITEEYIDAQLDIVTYIGTSTSDLKLTNIDDIDNASYVGSVSVENFDLGIFLNDPSLGSTTFDLVVDGKGFIQENLNTEVQGTIASLGYNGYDYKGLIVSGVVKDQLFDGKLVSKDENFKLDFEGLADFSGELNDFNFKASVDYANLKKLNFTSNDNLSIFKGDVAMNMVGTNLNDIEGEIRFTKTNYQNQNDNYYFEDFKVTSSFDEGIRTLKINSPDIVNGSVKGKFYIEEVGKLVENSIGSIYANYSPYEVRPGQFLDFNFNIYNKIVDVFFPDITFGTNTYIRGSIKADEEDFKLTFRSPNINAYGNIFDNINLQVDNKNPLFNTFVEVKNIDSKWYDVKEFNLINTTLNDTLFFRTEFAGGEGNGDEYNLNFYHTINPQKRSVVGIKKSDLSFKGNTWYLNPENNKQNRVVFNKRLDSISIEEIVMRHNDELINFRGEMIDSTYKDLSLRFKNVSLDKITPSIDSLKLDGKVNGLLDILQNKSRYVPTSSLSIQDLAVNEKVLGDLNVDVTGNDDLTKYQLDAGLVNKDLKSLSAKGDISLINDELMANIDTQLRELDISVFSPLGEDVINDIRGYVSADAKISGKLKNPSIDGKLQLLDAGLNVPYLGVNYDFSRRANVNLYGQTFEFDNAGITDLAYGSFGYLNGTISHTEFSDWMMDIVIDTDNLLVLNTKESEDELYYGTAFMNGKAHIHGATDQLTIDVEADTNPGTSIKIPVSDVASIGDNSFIKFVNKKNVDDPDGNGGDAENYKGLELNFDLNVTPDAEVEIVLDKKSGSTLKGRGFGGLLMEIDTKGKFNMWGDFITQEGTYNFKYRGLIDKKFTVKPEGTIIWEGDPLQAIVNIEAVYDVPGGANPAIVLDNPNFNRKIPTEVIIKLEGQLLQPDSPKFEINLPNTSGIVKSELEYRLADEERRQLQAISLLSQGVYISDVSISQQAITNNLFETASTLFNNLFGNDDKLKVGVSYVQGDRYRDIDLETEDRLGLTLTTQVSDRILVNGKIGVPVGGVNETVIIGDLQVDFLLNEDGSLRAKVFNKENEFQYIGDEIGYTQGVGISYQLEFDSFKELLQKIFKKEANKKDEEDKKKEEIITENPTPGFINFTAKEKKEN